MVNKKRLLTITLTSIIPIIFTISCEQNTNEKYIYFDKNGGSSLTCPNFRKVTSITKDVFSYDLKKEGYIFKGWLYQDRLIYDEKGHEYLKLNLVENMIFYAKWDYEKYPVNVYASDPLKGEVEGGGMYEYTANVTVKAKPIDNNVFKGWYFDDKYANYASSDISYTFSVPLGGILLYAKFYSAEEEQEEIYQKEHGAIPVINGKTATFGLYPQTHVYNPSDELLEAAKKAKDTSRFIYNNEYYCQSVGNPCSGQYYFSTGELIVKDKTYYFKYEPIEWSIGKIEDNYTYILRSKKLLFSTIFSDKTNIYFDSILRQKLNEEFYNTAFYFGKSYLVPIKDESLGIINGDNVILGSIDDYLEGSNNDKCNKELTDFALCNNAKKAIYDGGGGIHWTSTREGDFAFHNYDYIYCLKGKYSTFFKYDSEGLSVSPYIKIKLH